eukprot:SAG11_NODE_2421_length_3380_cov_2.614752_2_plen_91_part_00
MVRCVIICPVGITSACLPPYLLRLRARDVDLIFGVEDVLPACKPEEAAFNKVLKKAETVATRAMMFEDSMKNIWCACPPSSCVFALEQWN